AVRKRRPCVKGMRMPGENRHALLECLCVCTINIRECTMLAAWRREPKENEIMAQKIDELNQTSQEFSSRVESVANEWMAVDNENAQALLKAYEAQYQAGLDLLKKSTDSLKGL